MNLEWSLTVAGLSIDILGVVLLFIATSAKKIEAELVTRAFRQSLDDSKDGEWVHQESFGEIDEGVSAAEHGVDRNRRLQGLALVAIVVGFFLQLLGKLL